MLILNVSRMWFSCNQSRAFLSNNIVWNTKRTQLGETNILQQRCTPRNKSLGNDVKLFHPTALTILEIGIVSQEGYFTKHSLD